MTVRNWTVVINGITFKIEAGTPHVAASRALESFEKTVAGKTCLSLRTGIVVTIR